MLNVKAFANAVTAVTAVFYVVCLVLSMVAPDLVRSIGNSWAHSINLELIKSTDNVFSTNALLGLVSVSVVAWVTTYATIWLYNKWAKK